MSVSVLEVTSLHAIPVVPLNGSVTLSTVSGDTIYYGQDQTVSSSNNTGSLTSGGSSVTLTTQGWVRSAGVSALQMVSGSPPQDVVIGTDGTVGGPGGTPVTSAVSVPNTFTASADANTPITIKGHSATQSGNLLAVQDSGANPLLTIGAKGAATFSPSNVAADSLHITIPNLDGGSGIAGLRIINPTGSLGRGIQIEHSALDGNSGLNNVGFEMHAYAGSSAGIVMHYYSGTSPFYIGGAGLSQGNPMVLDNTQNASTIMVRNAQNANLCPGSHGTGAVLEYRGYYKWDTTNATGVVSGTTLLTDTTNGAWITEDIGKVIMVAGNQTTVSDLPYWSTVSSPPGSYSGVTSLDVTGAPHNLSSWPTSGPLAVRTSDLGWVTGAYTGISGSTITGITGLSGIPHAIASVINPTAITLQNAQTNASGVTYSYTKNPQQMMQWQSNNVFMNFSDRAPFTFQTNAAGTDALKVIQPAGSANNGLWVQNAGTGPAVTISQTGNGKGIQLTNSGTATGVNIVQSGAANALAVTAQAGAATVYAMTLSAQDFGLNLTQALDNASGFGLIVTKSATGAGTVCRLSNAGTGDTLQVRNGSTNWLVVKSTGSLVLGGGAALATNATDGFVYLPTCAGAPSGTPTTQAGGSAAIYDTTDNKLYVYNGGWKSVTLA